jgi:flagellar biosynthesis protein FlhF
VELIGKARTVSVFVGPTGSGKTTTIAKIAAHARARYKKRVALISTDLFRVGGHDQLLRYGDLIGVATYSCADLTALNDLIASLDDRDLIMIDTPGSSPSDLARLGKLETITAMPEARVHLVVSASTRSEDITRIVKRFQRFSPRRVVITKIDETDPKGAFVGDILRNEMPISYMTGGQHVPEDLIIPSAQDIVRFVLPGEKAHIGSAHAVAASVRAQ